MLMTDLLCCVHIWLRHVTDLSFYVRACVCVCVQIEEQAQATDRLASIEKLQTSVTELKDCCTRLETEKSELEMEIDKLKASMLFADETAKTKQEEMETISAELQQV